MEFDDIYKQYVDYLTSLINVLFEEQIELSNINKEERISVSNIDKEYFDSIKKITDNEKNIRQQYHEVYLACKDFGVLSSEDKRAKCTPLNWCEAIKIQNNEAKRIKKWIDYQRKIAIERKEAIRRRENEKRKRAVETQLKVKQENELLRRKMLENEAMALINKLKNQYR